MALFINQQTVTEIHPLKPYDKKSVMIITLQSGRKLYVDDVDFRRKSICIQQRSFDAVELGLFKRRIRHELFDKTTDAKEITNFLEADDTRIVLNNALSTYVSPISRLLTRRLCIDHNRIIKPHFSIEKAGSGSNLPPVTLPGLGDRILSVTLEDDQ